jgi:NAD(P)-dependent dehydrogenase (short-subunit alcohol dehydrogenase family)
MSALQGRTGVVIGGSSGVGRATVKALISQGVRVTAVARRADRLKALEAEAGAGVTTLAGDAADAAVVERILREPKPDLVVLAAGVTPRMAALDELDWDSFSAAWNTDLKASFLVVQRALRLPLAPGSVIALVSSGAAIAGSWMSGGYAGAKRMQWWLASYARKVSEARALGIRVIAVLPKQLIEGTTIGAGAAAGYGATQGITQDAYMKRWDIPLTVEKVASAIVAALDGSVPAAADAIGVTGAGFEPMP